MPTTQLESFYKHFVKAMHEGNAGVFVGAGLSRACGFVDWKGLLKEIATDLGLDIDEETDLIALAQFYETKQMNRAKLDRLIIEEFTKDTALSDNHKLLANLPIDTVWTTNYDKLIEAAFEEAHRRVDVKKTQESLQHPLPGRGVTVYKMHGDVDSPQDAVLTKEDYETYDLNRELFSIKLKGDLVGKTFLFVGFSFTDPNIDKASTMPYCDGRVGQSGRSTRASRRFKRLKLATLTTERDWTCGLAIFDDTASKR